MQGRRRQRGGLRLLDAFAVVSPPVREHMRFASPGTALQWRATLLSTDLMTSPRLETLTLDYTTSP